MKKVIIVRVCEIFLKGKNRFYFVNLLESNIKKALADVKFNIVKLQMRYLIEDFDENDYELIVSKLLKVSGIHTLSEALCVESDVDKIAEAAIKICDGKSGTFKVETNRADKTFPMHSVELSAEVGGRVLETYPGKFKVDVKKPAFVVHIDIRENGETLVYSGVIKGVGGMPVGSSGKGFLMLSGGIDSPVAGYMMARRGLELTAVHFYSYPYTSERARDKVVDLARIVSRYSGPIKLHLVPFTEIQLAIYEKCPPKETTVLMRRLMMKIAQLWAEKDGARALITGEALGQVASQTLESLCVTDDAVTMPVFRPLIGFDKNDIVAIAKKIDTFNTSILPYEDCCTVFVPQHPVTKPEVQKMRESEALVDFSEMIQRAIENTETVTAI